MDPLRPVPRPTALARVRATVEWVRLPRLVAMAVSVLIVAAGSWWLLRSPAPPVEQSLPYAAISTAKSSTSSKTSVPSKPSGSELAVSEPPSSAASSVAVPIVETTVAGPMIVVQAAGQVIDPGVYRLQPGSRVDDLIARAGGPTASADAQSVNLAAPLVDGQRVYLPKIGEVATTIAGQATTATHTPAGATPAPGPIDINHADAATIDGLPGIGPATAAAIVAYRETNGPFGSAEDLLRVRGIGPAKLEVIRAMVTT